MKIVTDFTVSSRPVRVGRSVSPALTTAAFGGIQTVITQGGKFYRVHSFLTSGTLTVTTGGVFAYLIVGGGGGGSQRTGPGGGGGGGQVLSGQMDLAADTYGIIVGNGGVGGNVLTATSATDGQASSLANIVSAGGKRGSQSGNTLLGADGGASGNVNPGGLAVQLTIDGASNATTRAGGGGGGASAAGYTATGTTEVPPTDITRPNGGAGTQSVIDGNPRGFGGGGGGGGGGGAGGNLAVLLQGFGTDGGGDGGTNTSAGMAAAPNMGGGGGGSGRASDVSGPGGSGIVIVRYEISQAEYEAAMT